MALFWRGFVRLMSSIPFGALAGLTAFGILEPHDLPSRPGWVFEIIVGVAVGVVAGILAMVFFTPLKEQFERLARYVDKPLPTVYLMSAIVATLLVGLPFGILLGKLGPFLAPALILIMWAGVLLLPENGTGGAIFLWGGTVLLLTLPILMLSVFAVGIPLLPLWGAAWLTTLSHYRLRVERKSTNLEDDRSIEKILV